MAAEYKTGMVLIQKWRKMAVLLRLSTIEKAIAQGRKKRNKKNGTSVLFNDIASVVL